MLLKVTIFLPHRIKAELSRVKTYKSHSLIEGFAIQILQVLPLPQNLPGTAQPIDVGSAGQKPTAETLAALDRMTGSHKKKKAAKPQEQNEPQSLSNAEILDPQARLQTVQASHQRLNSAYIRRL